MPNDIGVVIELANWHAPKANPVEEFILYANDASNQEDTITAM